MRLMGVAVHRFLVKLKCRHHVDYHGLTQEVRPSHEGSQASIFGDRRGIKNQPRQDVVGHLLWMVSRSGRCLRGHRNKLSGDGPHLHAQCIVAEQKVEWSFSPKPGVHRTRTLGLAPSRTQGLARMRIAAELRSAGWDVLQAIGGLKKRGEGTLGALLAASTACRASCGPWLASRRPRGPNRSFPTRARASGIRGNLPPSCTCEESTNNRRQQHINDSQPADLPQAAPSFPPIISEAPTSRYPSVSEGTAP